MDWPAGVSKTATSKGGKAKGKAAAVAAEAAAKEEDSDAESSSGADEEEQPVASAEEEDEVLTDSADESDAASSSETSGSEADDKVDRQTRHTRHEASHSKRASDAVQPPQEEDAQSTGAGTAESVQSDETEAADTPVGESTWQHHVWVGHSCLRSSRGRHHAQPVALEICILLQQESSTPGCVTVNMQCQASHYCFPAPVFAMFSLSSMPVPLASIDNLAVRLYCGAATLPHTGASCETKPNIGAACQQLDG